MIKAKCPICHNEDLAVVRLADFSIVMDNEGHIVAEGNESKYDAKDIYCPACFTSLKWERSNLRELTKDEMVENACIFVTSVYHLEGIDETTLKKGIKDALFMGNL